MATHSSVFAWETLWTEEPGGLQSMRLRRVGHDLATKQQQPMNLFVRKGQRSRCRGQTCGHSGKGESGTNWSSIDIYPLPRVKQMQESAV